MNSITVLIQARWRSLVICAVALLGLGFLFFVNPTAARWFPPCPFHVLTGLDCPGCGSLRALHSLLHLDVMRALSYNPLMCVCLPFLGGWWLWHAGRAITGRAAPVPFIRPALLWVVVAMIFAFGITRNILPPAPVSASTASVNAPLMVVPAPD